MTKRVAIWLTIGILISMACAVMSMSMSKVNVCDLTALGFDVFVLWFIWDM